MPDMLPYIMDAEFNTIGVIDDYISLIWTGRYFNCGDFELQTDITEKARELLQKDNYIWRTDDENIGIIESIRIARDEEEHETLIVSGRFLPGLLARRIIAQNVDYKGKFSDVVNTLINDNAINPAIPARKIPGLKLGEYAINSRVDRHFDGENLLEKIEEMSEAHNVGFNVTLTDQNEFLFVLYEGVDRSYNQSVNPYVVFSGKFDNLKSSDYEENFGGTVTDVLVIGDEVNDDGETGTDAQQRYEVWAYKALNAGLSRYETSFSPSSSGNDELTEQEYIDQLKSEGKAQVTQYEAAFTGDVYFNNIQYRQDVFLGDIVTIENSEWGIYINARIIEIIESVDESGLYTVVPTFAVASGVAGDDATEYIDTESGAEILTAQNVVLMTEGTEFDSAHSPYGGAVRISELDAATTLNDADYLPLSQGANTRKLAISLLRDLLGGTNDYNDLANKPTIEAVTVEGDKTFSDYNMVGLTNSEIESMLN